MGVGESYQHIPSLGVASVGSLNETSRQGRQRTLNIGPLTATEAFKFG